MADETVDVLIVGAGLSGIGAACHLQKRCPDRSFAIIEARQALGGTWDLFRYPGVRSDSDMYTLGYSFRPWTGDKAIAEGPAILQYLRDTAREHGIEDRIRFGHRLRRRRVVVRRSRLDRGHRARCRRAAAPALRLPVDVHRLLRRCRGLHARISKAASASPAASCIRSTGPTTSTTPASAWW